MGSLAFNFGLDLQELNRAGGKSVDNLRQLICDNINNIDRENSIGQTIAFIDNSGCEFTGHDILLIEDMELHNGYGYV